MPVLEGMQFGAPSITSNVSSLPEVVGSASVLLPPKDVKGWGCAIANLVKDELWAKELSDASLKQSMKFNLVDSSRKMLDLYERVANSPKRDCIR